MRIRIIVTRPIGCDKEREWTPKKKKRSELRFIITKKINLCKLECEVC